MNPEKGLERALPQGKSAELQASASIPRIFCCAGTAGWIRAACLAGKQGVGCVHLDMSGSGCVSRCRWWQQDEETVAVTQQWGLSGQRRCEWEWGRAGLAIWCFFGWSWESVLQQELAMHSCIFKLPCAIHVWLPAQRASQRVFSIFLSCALLTA